MKAFREDDLYRISDVLNPFAALPGLLFQSVRLAHLFCGRRFARISISRKGKAK